MASPIIVKSALATLSAMLSYFAYQNFFNEDLTLSEIVEKVNASNTTWQAEYYERFDRPNNNVNFGLKKTMKKLLNSNDGGLPYTKWTEEEIAKLPKSFDVEEKWGECKSIHDVRD